MTAAVRSSRPKIVIYQQLFRYIFKRKKTTKKNSKTNKQTKQNKKEKKRKKGKRRSLAEFEPGTFGLTRPHTATTPLRMITKVSHSVMPFSMELPPANDRAILNRLKKRLEVIG